MPRTSKTTAAEIEAIEQTEANRIASRKTGLSLIEVRDRGWGRLRELSGSDVVLVWGVKDSLHKAGLFKLVVDKKELILDGEEFRKWLRWV